MGSFLEWGIEFPPHTAQASTNAHERGRGLHGITSGSLFHVTKPRRIVRIQAGMHQSVPNDGGRISMEETKRYVSLLGLIIRRKEPPVAMPESHIVFSLDPPHAFLRMTGFRPPPDHVEDHVIHA